MEGAGRKAGEEDRVKAPCVWVGWGHFREAGGATEDAGCALGWGCAAPAATPLGKPTAELRVILHGEDVLLSHTHRCWGLGLGGDNGRAGVAWLGPPGWSRSSEQVPEHEPRPRRARSADTRAGEEPDEVPMSFPSPLSTDFAASDGHARNHGKSKTPEITEPLSPRGRHESGVL